MIADLYWRVRVSVAGITGWEFWRLPGRIRVYITSVHAVALTVLGVALATTRWHVRDIAVFVALTCCATVTIEATRKISVAHGTIFHDMQSVWYITAAALLPPCYTLLVPMVLTPLRIKRMTSGIAYRRVFSGSACALAYGATAAIFAHLPHSVAGPDPGSGIHVVTWLVALACCGAFGLALNNALLITAIKLSDPAASVRKLAFDRESAVTDVCQLNLAVLIALPVAFSPFLLAGALPVVTVMRRLMMHAQLMTASRMDTKTGLLNAATWQREAELEVARAMRAHTPLAIAIADIDHFKAVNDRHGHLTGDAVLALVSATMSALLRDYDLLGRFGGEEFAICLPHTGPAEAQQVAERLREKISRIGAQSPGEAPIQITISVGVASLESSRRTLDELIAAADAALYRAKASGRNCVRITLEERGISALCAVPTRPRGDSAVVGIVLYERILIALRRLAEEDASSRAWTR
jgi:diguanylate cyclase (GGDEF)-like protein